MEMRNITKQFGDFKANTNVNIHLNKNEVLTLLGENGAGKSTLMNCLCGLYLPTEGEIFIRGNHVNIDNPSQAVSLGIGMVHQHFMLIESMTVLENIILGKSGTDADKKIFIDKKQLKKDISDLSNKYGLHVNLDALVSDISIGEQQRVEILKALYRGAEILILDEPTAVLTDEEVAGLFDITEKLKAEGKGIIFISHKMKEVMHLSDRITILRSGHAVATLNIEDTNADELANLMVGRELQKSIYEKKESSSENRIELEAIQFNADSKHGSLRNISLKVKAGEILGVAGVDGNGQSQLASLLTGLIKPDSGKLVLKGKEIENYKPLAFIDDKIGHIPEDRNRMGLVGDMMISENLILKLTSSERFSKHNGMNLNKKAINQYALEMKDQYDIRASSINEQTKNLSGGNQQKVILARELDAKPDILVAVHPTRGLDIGATQFVHDNMIKARDEGCAIVMISADLDEVLKVSDRLIVMYEGEIMGEYSGANPLMFEISQAMAGKKTETITS